MEFGPSANRNAFEKPIKWRHTPKSSRKSNTNLSSSITQSETGNHNQHRRRLSSFWKDEFLSTTPNFLRVVSSGDIQHEPPFSFHRQEGSTGSSKSGEQPVTYDFYRSILLVMHRIEELLNEKNIDSKISHCGDSKTNGHNNVNGNHHSHEDTHSIRRDSMDRLVLNAVTNADDINHEETTTSATRATPTEFTSTTISISNLVDRILDSKSWNRQNILSDPSKNNNNQHDKDQHDDEDQDKKQQDPLSAEDIHPYPLPDLMCALYICLQRTQQLVPIEMEEDMLRLKTDEDISTFLSSDTTSTRTRTSSSHNNNINKTNASLKNGDGVKNDRMQSFAMNNDSTELDRLTFISVISHLANLVRIEYHTVAGVERRRDSDVTKTAKGDSLVRDGNSNDSNNTRSTNLLNVLAETFGPLLLCRDINEKSTVWSRHYYLSKERIRRRVIKRIIRHFHSGLISANTNTAANSTDDYGTVEEDGIGNLPVQPPYQNFSDCSNRAVKVSHISQENEDMDSIEIENNNAHDDGRLRRRTSSSSTRRVLFQEALDATNSSTINEEKHSESSNLKTRVLHNRSHRSTERDTVTNATANVSIGPAYTDNSFLSKILNELGQCCSYPMQEDVSHQVSILVDNDDNLTLRMRERLDLADNVLQECQSY